MYKYTKFGRDMFEHNGELVLLHECILCWHKDVKHGQNHASQISISFTHVMGGLEPVEKLMNYNTKKVAFERPELIPVSVA